MPVGYLESTFESAQSNGSKLRAIIYDRISEDPDGERENVEIRLAESREYAADQGWVVVAEYSDNDLSAAKYSRKPRPGYQAMFHAVAASACEIVVTTEMERLYRQVEELLPLIKLAERTTLRRIACTDGSGYDLSSGPGIHGAIGAVNNAMLESRKISDRTKRKKAAKARDGAWWGGTRPFGYQLAERFATTNTGKRYTYYALEIDPAEAELIREGIGRVLAGETPTGIARNWTDRGIRGARGGVLEANQMRRLLSSAHVAGLRAYHGKLMPGSWPAIVDRETWERARAVLERTPLSADIIRPRLYLLSGILFCPCGSPMRAHRNHGRAGYECKRRQNGGGHARRAGEPVEDALRDAALTALANREFRAALETELRARQATDTTVRELIARREQDRQQLTLLRDRLADGVIDPEDFRHAKDRINERLAGIERALAAKSSPEAGLLAQLPEELEALEAAWAGWDRDLDRRRAVLRLAFNRVTVRPTRHGRKNFDARAELDPDWRVYT